MVNVMSSVVLKVTFEPRGIVMPSRVSVRAAVVNVVGSIAFENVTPMDETGWVRGVVIGETWAIVGGALADWTVKFTDPVPLPAAPEVSLTPAALTVNVYD